MSDPLYIKGLQEQRDWMASLRKDYVSGIRKIGRLENDQQVDETEAEINDLTSRIENLDRVLAAYEKRGAPQK